MRFTPTRCATLRLPAKETKTLKAAQARPSSPGAGSQQAGRLPAASPHRLSPGARGGGEPEKGLGLPGRGKEGGQRWRFPTKALAERLHVLF